MKFADLVTSVATGDIKSKDSIKTEPMLCKNWPKICSVTSKEVNTFFLFFVSFIKVCDALATKQYKISETTDLRVYQEWKKVRKTRKINENEK